MEYRRLGNSGLKVSTLCLGTMTFGEADENSFMHKVSSDEATSFSIMNRALDAGVNFFDTANVYGQNGLSERVIGKWFESTGRRDEVVLATKFRFRMQDGPNGTGASRRHIVQACEESLKRLKTDRIDLYQIHMQDRDTLEEETLRALDDLVRAGKVLYVGCSNYAAYRLCDSAWIAKTRGLTSFVALQAQYSMAVRDIERELVPACEQHGLGILPWSPLGGGFLTGKYTRDQAPSSGRYGDSQKFAGWWKTYDNDRGWRTLDACRAVAAETGASVAQVALAWLIRKPQVTSVIFGARNMQQLEDNLKATEVALSDAQMAQLDEASALELGYPYEFIKGVQGRW